MGESKKGQPGGKKTGVGEWKKMRKEEEQKKIEVPIFVSDATQIAV